MIDETCTIDSAAIRDWLLDLRAAGKAAKTIETYGRAAQAFLAFTGNEVSRRHLRDWLSVQSSKSTASQRIYLTSVRQFLRWLVAEEILAEDPSTGLRTPRVKTAVVQPLTRQEVAALIRACAGRPRDEAVIRFLSSSGARISECANALVEHLNLERHSLLVLGKGSKWRVVPFDDGTALAISRYQRRVRQRNRYAADPHLWLSERGPITQQGIDRMLHRAAERAGVDGVHAHRFRHTFADSWLSAGGSEGGLMSVAGWSSRSMLDRYSAARATDRALDEYRRLKR